MTSWGNVWHRSQFVIHSDSINNSTSVSSAQKNCLGAVWAARTFFKWDAWLVQQDVEETNAKFFCRITYWFVGCFVCKQFLFSAVIHHLCYEMPFAIMGPPKNVGPNWRPPKIGGPVRPHTWNMPKAGTVRAPSKVNAALTYALSAAWLGCITCSFIERLPGYECTAWPTR